MMLRRLLAAALLLALPGPALAHSGHGEVGSLAGGLLHPITGLDHVLAMVAVGLLAAHLGGRSIWAVPLAVMGVMLSAGALAVAGVPLPLMEFGIVASVLVLGGLIASGWSLPGKLALGLVAVFAVFHGYAHGHAMPGSASGLLYAAGFVSTTGLLHATGLALGLALGRFGPPLAVRSAGLAIVVLGAGLAVA